MENTETRKEKRSDTRQPISNPAPLHCCGAIFMKPPVHSERASLFRAGSPTGSYISDRLGDSGLDYSSLPVTFSFTASNPSETPSLIFFLD